MGILKIGRTLGVGTSVVQRVLRPKSGIVVEMPDGRKLRGKEAEQQAINEQWRKTFEKDPTAKHLDVPKA